jgi:serine/threonine protein kinase
LSASTETLVCWLSQLIHVSQARVTVSRAVTRLQQEIWKSKKEIQALGVRHEDLRLENILWNDELQRALIIDFHRSKLDPRPTGKRSKKRPLCNTEEAISLKRPHIEILPLWEDLKKPVESDGQKLRSGYSLFTEETVKIVESPEISVQAGIFLRQVTLDRLLTLNLACFEGGYSLSSKKAKMVDDQWPPWRTI